MFPKTYADISHKHCCLKSATLLLTAHRKNVLFHSHLNTNLTPAVSFNRAYDQHRENTNTIVCNIFPRRATKSNGTRGLMLYTQPDVSGLRGCAIKAYFCRTLQTSALAFLQSHLYCRFTGLRRIAVLHRAL